MAIARLAHVALFCRRRDLQTLLVRLCEFGQFHPLEREGLDQDIEVLILSSKAQAIYAAATDLLPEGYFTNTVPSGFGVVTFSADGPSSLVELLSNRLTSLQSLLAQSPDPVLRENLLRNAKAIQEAALAMFNNLHRIKFTRATKRLLILEGFVPSKEIERFRASLGNFLLSCEPVGKREAEESYVPSMFSNRRVVSLFENITLTRGFPKYNEIDPTPVIAIVFPLFFGIMFSDLGHGIVLFLFGYVLTRTFRGNYNYWGKLVMVLGSASIVTGFVRGLFFGLEFKTPLNLLPFFPVVITSGFSIDVVSFWLEISIVFGTFHLISGYGISFLNRVYSKDYAEAFLSGLPTIILYSSGVPLMLAAVGAGLQVTNFLSNNNSTPFFKDLLGVNIPVSLVAGIALPFFIGSILVLFLGRLFIVYRQEPRTGAAKRLSANLVLKSIGLGLLDGLAKPFEFFTNTISYLRLGILLILGTILVTLSSSALGMGLVGIPIAIVANIAVMAIEAFMVYIQDLRLHVYEWVSHFYSGSGIPFQPLSSEGLDFLVNWK